MQGWACTQVFESHSHYVMQCVFNPKDTNTFASASLDRTVKVTSWVSAVPHALMLCAELLSDCGRGTGLRKHQTCTCLHECSFFQPICLPFGGWPSPRGRWEYESGLVVCTSVNFCNIARKLVKGRVQSCGKSIRSSP